MEFLTDNILLTLFGLVVSAALAYLGFKGGKKYQNWFKWANELAFFAWHSAEEKGILEGIKGRDKLAHYLSIWQEAYEKKFGEEMTDKALEFATKRAMELSEADKTLKAQVKALADPKL